MNDRHLYDDEFEAVLCGAGIPADRAVHLSVCRACQARRDGFLLLMDEIRGEDPPEAETKAVRERALDRWQADASHRPVARWWLAAAAVLVLALVPLSLHHREQPATPTFNAAAVLADVDQVLERDPLTAMSPEAVVDVVVPVNSSSSDGGA